MSRFECPSLSFGLRSLLRRRTVAIGLAVSVALHSALTSLRVLKAEEQTARPLTTQFVKRQPRLTKPLELKKRPQPKRRRVERTMVAVKARADRREVSSRIRPAGVLGSLARPRTAISSEVA